MFSFNLVIVEAVIIKGLNFENWVIDTNFGLNQQKWHTFPQFIMVPISQHWVISKILQKCIRKRSQRPKNDYQWSGKEEFFYPNLLDREGLQLDGEEFKKKSILIAFYRLSHLHLSIYPIFCCTILLRIKTKRKKKQTKNNNKKKNKNREERKTGGGILPADCFVTP